MELFIFDRNLNLLGIIDAFTSLLWTRRYYKVGEFELHCDLTSYNLNLLQKGNLIWKQGDNEAAYINFRDFKQDTDGKEILIVKGKFLTNYLNQRIVWNIVNKNDTYENVMRYLVDQNCINPTDTNRTISKLSLATLKNLTPAINYQQGNYPNLNDEIENLSLASDLGHRILFDAINKTLKFEVYAGIDRSVNQSIISPCIFSKEFENVLEQEFTDSNDNLKNVALLNGMYVTATTKTPQSATVGSSIGLDRYELYIDATNITSEITDANNNKTYLSTNDYNNLLVGQGAMELAQYPEVETFDSKINVNSNIIYKTDFDLGDIVTCTSKKWGITLDTRISEVEEVYEEQGVQINVTFGNNVPTLIDKIKQRMR